MAQWFVLRNEDVSGPFDTEEIKGMAAQGDLSDRDLVWGRPQTEWRPLSWWTIELPNLLQKTQEVKDLRLWHFASAGTAQGPFSRADLVAKLKDIDLSQDLLVWTKGMKAWAPIFEFNDILDEVGVNRRQYPRAEIEGRVALKIGQNSFEGTLATISEGGFGANKITGLVIGQVLSAELSSDAFYDTIHAKVEVRYFTETGYVGFRFQHLNMESKGAIIQYVKGYRQAA
jgi:hypothetical protein